MAGSVHAAAASAAAAGPTELEAVQRSALPIANATDITRLLNSADISRYTQLLSFGVGHRVSSAG